MKRIVIICQGRTGSTNLSDFYKKKYKIKNLGEVFRHKDYVDNSITVKGNFSIIEDYDVEEQVFQVEKNPV